MYEPISHLHTYIGTKVLQNPSLAVYVVEVYNLRLAYIEIISCLNMTNIYTCTRCDE